MPVVISGGGAVATVADTPQIDLGLTNAQLTADVVAGSIGSTQLSSAVNSALTLAGTAVQPAALTSYLPLSGGALTGAVTSTSTLTTRQSANTVQSLVVSGTTQTIDWNNGGSINLDLSSASGNVTLTLQNPVIGAVYRIRVQQGATVRNLTFPDGTVQQGVGGNVYTGIAGVDFLTVYYNGSAYLVQSALNSGFVQPTNNAIFTGVTQLAALRLNSVAFLVSNSAPTATATGDLSYNPSTGIWGFWRSPYWLSAYQKTLSHIQLNGVSTSSSSFHHGIPSGGSVFVESVYCYTIVSATNDGSNYWTIAAGLARPQDTNVATVGNFSTVADSAGARLGKLNNANTAVASNYPNNSSGLVFRLDWTKVGSPGLLYASVSLNYRDIL